jgi:hypothetical protein
MMVTVCVLLSSASNTLESSCGVCFRSVRPRSNYKAVQYSFSSTLMSIKLHETKDSNQRHVCATLRSSSYGQLKGCGNPLRKVPSRQALKLPDIRVLAAFLCV